MKLKPIASLTAASLAVLLGACSTEEGVGQPTVESERIEEIPADVVGVDPSQVEADANEIVPAPTVSGATEELAIDVDEVDEVAETDSVEPVDPDGDVLERDSAAEIEAVSAEASAEAGETWRALQANWEASVADVQAEFEELDETRLHGTGGDRGALVALIADSYDVDPVEAERRVAEWEARL